MALGLGFTGRQIEDALWYLYQSGNIGKDFKIQGWSPAHHKKTHASKYKPVQTILFGSDELISKGTRKNTNDYAAESTVPVEHDEVWVDRDRVVEVSLPRSVNAETWMRTRAKDVVEKDGWEIKKWLYVTAKGSDSPYVAITVRKRFCVYKNESAKENQVQAAEDSSTIEGP